MEPNFAVLNMHSGFSTSAGGLAVYPLWKGGVQDALLTLDQIRATLTRRLAVAAVLPDQTLDLNEMDALEAAGLLVVEVPHGLRSSAPDAVAAFVECQVDGPEAGTSIEPAPSPSHMAAAPDADSDFVPALSDEDESALLRAINDPASDEGFA